ncbi:MAG: formylglycine-generating enzyme family protein, partial [Planctomycetales bacterium]
MMRNVQAILAAGTCLAVLIAPQASRSQDAATAVTNSVGMKLILVPSGSFTMGSRVGEADRDSREVVHRVNVTKSFYLGVFETTQSQFAKVMGQQSRTKAVFDTGRGGGAEHPMENVEWQKANEFCKQLSGRQEERQAGRSYRLPTEAEWEYACRAGTSTAFHFGKSLSSKQANFNGNYPAGKADKGPYLRKTAKVGSYQPNAFGLHDMHG